MTLLDDDATIGEQHFLCAAFGPRIEIMAPTDDADLAFISDTIWGEYIQNETRDITIDELFSFTRSANDNLHSLRRWISAVMQRKVRGEAVSSVQVSLLPSLDLRYLIKHIEYRGRVIDVADLQAWFSQFPPPVRPLAWTLLRHVAISYYIPRKKYFEALDTCAIEAGIPSGTKVCFCRSQELGRSGPRVTHELKNLAHWRTDHELDLTATNPNRAQVSHHRWFVFADDFAGSGDTLHQLVERSIKPLLEEFPKAEVRILIAVAFQDAIERCVDALRSWQSRVRVIPGLLFNDEDRCFTPHSRILRQESQREALKNFCSEAARRHFPSLWTRGHHLGWNGLAALVILPDTVPNNTLPIMWFRSESWNPIFPASGLLEDYQ